MSREGAGEEIRRLCNEALEPLREEIVRLTGTPTEDIGMHLVLTNAGYISAVVSDGDDPLKSAIALCVAGMMLIEKLAQSGHLGARELLKDYAIDRMMGGAKPSPN